jgi:hypothetical protein
MKKANKAQLHLQREVLRLLQAPDLANIIGGLAPRPIKPSATTERAGACCA